MPLAQQYRARDERLSMTWFNALQIVTHSSSRAACLRVWLRVRRVVAGATDLKEPTAEISDASTTEKYRLDKFADKFGVEEPRPSRGRKGNYVTHKFRSSGRLMRRWFPGVRTSNCGPQAGSSSSSRRRIDDSLHSSWSAAACTGTQSLSNS